MCLIGGAYQSFISCFQQGMSADAVPASPTELTRASAVTESMQTTVGRRHSMIECSCDGAGEAGGSCAGGRDLVPDRLSRRFAAHPGAARLPPAGVLKRAARTSVQQSTLAAPRGSAAPVPRTLTASARFGEFGKRAVNRPIRMG